MGEKSQGLRQGPSFGAVSEHESNLKWQQGSPTVERLRKSPSQGGSFSQVTFTHKSLGKRDHHDESERSLILSTNSITYQKVPAEERPCQYDICDQSFQENLNLMSHREIHKAECPCISNKCWKTFRGRKPRYYSTSGNLTLERRSLHVMNVENPSAKTRFSKSIRLQDSEKPTSAVNVIKLFTCIQTLLSIR